MKMHYKSIQGATHFATIKSFYGLRRVERRLPRPSHPTYEKRTRTAPETRTSVGQLLRRIIESGNVNLARDKTGATGEHTGRRLRELTEEGILEVQYRRGHAFYRLKEAVPQLFQ